jgi:hypothetical protein
MSIVEPNRYPWITTIDLERMIRGWCLEFFSIIHVLHQDAGIGVDYRNKRTREKIGDNLTNRDPIRVSNFYFVVYSQ